MGLDYGHTCPIIDGDIESMKDSIKYCIIELLDIYSSVSDNEILELVADKWKENFYSELESYIEDVRKCNEDIREEANKQIDDAEDERDEYKAQCEDLEKEIKRIEDSQFA